MTEAEPSLTDSFEAHRGPLLGLAYRMLGSRAEAEDAVQEAWLRWRETDRSRVQQPRAFLTQTVTRLCLDRLKSAQAQREVYVGPWLPEPILEDESLLQPGPEAASEFASDLSNAFMLALERLSPLERAAFLLHDVFDTDFAEVARALGRSEAACRQLAARARSRVREARPRYQIPPEQSQRLVVAFLGATQSGDTAALTRLLAADVSLISDGGGRVPAIGIPVHGRDRVAKVLLGLARKHRPPPGTRIQPAWINGQAGCLITAADGTPMQTLAFEFDDGALISGIYTVRNPDKLRFIGRDVTPVHH